MSWIKLIIISNLIFILCSCQVQETSSTDLVSGHSEVENKFIINEPSSQILKSGDKVSIYLSFPFPVTVNTSNGIPYLGLIIGSSNVQANYVSGNGSKKLLFQYTISASDQDNDGIKVNSLNANGATLKFDKNGVLTDCSTSLESKVLTQLTVDNSGPQISNLYLANFPGFYHLDDSITLMVVFNEVVKVTGSPKIGFDFSSGGSVFANYSAGSNSKTISFTYKITSNDADTNGFEISSPIDLNNGSIKDAAGNEASLDISSFITMAQLQSLLIKFDGQVPYSTTVSVPNSGVYVAAQDLNISVNFNRPVTISGNPFITITIGNNVREAHYISGTGSSKLIFRYSTVPGDVDLDGISISTTINQNDGDILGALSPQNSFFTHSEINLMNVPSTFGILINATQPQATSVTKNNDSTSPMWGTSPDNVWIVGQQILLTVGFNTGIYVNQNNGTPRIPITIGSTSKHANYLSGGNGQNSIVFAYSIEEGDMDNDGSISLGNIDLNGGTITDSYSTNSTLTLPVSSISGVTIDGIRPQINSVLAPSNGSYSETNQDDFDFTINWSEPVFYTNQNPGGTYLALTIGSSSVSASYSSGNNSSTIIHSPITLSGLSDLDGISMIGTLGGAGLVKDQAGNAATILTFTPPNTSNIFIDSNAPSIINITPPAAGDYSAGEHLDFLIEFSESVTVNTSGGNPYLLIEVGNEIRLASVSSGTGTTHTFRYTITSEDSDPDFVSFYSFSISIPVSSHIRDSSSNNLISTTFSDPSWTGVSIVEIPPSITNASATPGTYVAADEGNDTLSIDLTFSKEVTVDTTNGSPAISLSLGTGTVEATYDPISSTSTILSFKYTIDSSEDMDLDGVTLNNSQLLLNGSSIVDDNNNNANLNIGSVTNISNVFIAPHAKVWIKGSTLNRSGFTNKPTISTTATLSAGYFLMNGSTNTLTISELNSVYAAYIALKSPASNDSFPQDLFDSGLFTFDNNSMDLSLTDSPHLKTSSGYNGNGNSHQSAMLTNNTIQLELIYPSGATFPTSPLVPSGFSGDIAEIILFESALSTGQKSHAYNYINNFYP